eukprot:gnl/TRDRNA2_/TRDRNA2_72755_c1_seq1.p1 gnl/TRDRNA2_/TRDRNA2_72755_c1~~gnl/TRDRNA2_/TRDRNA2_72755_c1_seq1.p1  ORF type:complete len:568 (-),score=58.12 gnl/TRDRNA2_/TRDRNA2_72755_c1_seq1:53-1552(-)
MEDDLEDMPELPTLTPRSVSSCCEHRALQQPMLMDGLAQMQNLERRNSSRQQKNTAADGETAAGRLASRSGSSAAGNGGGPAASPSPTPGPRSYTNTPSSATAFTGPSNSPQPRAATKSATPRSRTPASQNKSPTPKQKCPTLAPICVSELHRDVTVTCPWTGRRAVGCTDDTIQIFIRIEGSETIGMRVHPNLRVGPKPREKNRFTDIFGDSAGYVAEQAVASLKSRLLRSSTRSSRDHSVDKHVPANFSDMGKSSPGALGDGAAPSTPQKGSLRPRASNIDASRSESTPAKDGARQSVQLSTPRSSSATPNTRRVLMKRDSLKAIEPFEKQEVIKEVAPEPDLDEVDSLKERLYLLTGLTPDRQRLVYRGMPMGSDTSTLREYGLMHGGQILLAVRDSIGPWPTHDPIRRTGKAENCYANSVPGGSIQVANKQGRPFKVLKPWVSDSRPGILCTSAKVQKDSSQLGSIYVFGESFHATFDSGHVDYEGMIRRMHGIV